MSETKKLFDAILREKAPFTVIDRNLHLGNPRYQFPSKYLSKMAPPVAHDDLMNLHKLIRWSINMNSVKYSETMFANRVYELQAFGNIVLSNYNTGINNMFPNVRMVHSDDDFRVIYNTKEKDLLELQAKGIRNVYNGHTTFHRVQEIAKTIGLDVETYPKEILVVLNNDSEQNLQSFNQQIYEHKSYILESDLDQTNLSSYDFITFFNDEYVYEEYYLNDMYNAFKYVDVDFVTKDENSEAHNYVMSLSDKYKSMIDIESYTLNPKIDSLDNGYNLDYLEILKVDDLATVDTNQEKELSVIVPIHNNGTYLEEKCFASLKRQAVLIKWKSSL